MAASSGGTRRRLLKGAAGAAAGAVASPMLNLGSFQAFADTPARYSARVMKIMESATVIDMLAPITLNASPLFAHRLPDAARADFRASRVTAVHNSIGVGGPSAREDSIAFLAAWQGFVGRNADLFVLVDKAADIDAAKAAGKIAVIMGLQNAEHFRTAADVQMFYLLGQRCSQLTYNSQNLLGSGGTERVDGGVSDFGAEIIKAMNIAGMLVDVSHCGDRTTLDAIEVSGGPIAITHSNCRALNNHPRLKTDEAIRKLAAKGGVMGVTGVRMFVSATEPTSVEQVVDHIDHVARLVGVEHVGVGTDSDLYGYDRLPEDQNKQVRAGYKASYAFREKIDTDRFNHPRKFYDLTEVLIRRGYGDENIAAVLGGNFRRLLGEVWRG
jgi:membrane dipeptidase